MAVYSDPEQKLSAVIRRHPTPLGPNRLEYVADVFREWHGESLLGRDFAEAVRLTSEWMGEG